MFFVLVYTLTVMTNVKLLQLSRTAVISPARRWVAWPLTRHTIISIAEMAPTLQNFLTKAVKFMPVSNDLFGNQNTPVSIRVTIYDVVLDL